MWNWHDFLARKEYYAILRREAEKERLISQELRNDEAIGRAYAPTHRVANWVEAVLVRLLRLCRFSLR
jgi:hypothetical protein